MVTNLSGDQEGVLRRSLVVAAGAGSMCALVPASYAQQTRTAKVGWLLPGGTTPEDDARYMQRNEARFRELGWTLNRNLTLEIRRFRGDPALLKSMAAELAAMNCDVIMAAENFALGTLLQVGAKGPIVVQAGSALPELGFIASYGRPGGNVTGLTWDQNEEIAAKGISILKDLVPNLRRVGYLTTVNNPGLDRYVSVAQRTTAHLGMTLTNVGVNGPSDFEAAFKNFQAERVQAVIIQASHLTYTHMQQLIELAGTYKIPDAVSFRLAVEMGALESYAPDLEDLLVRSVDYVDKILRGAKPADLPVQGPTRFEFVLNMKRARALGLPISTAIRSLADHVVE